MTYKEVEKEMVQIARKHKYRVVFVHEIVAESLDGEFCFWAGQTCYSDKMIEVAPGRTETFQLLTLIHEVGHVVDAKKRGTNRPLFWREYHAFKFALEKACEYRKRRLLKETLKRIIANAISFKYPEHSLACRRLMKTKLFNQARKLL